MKVDLTARDIELILVHLSESIEDDMYFRSSVEVIALLDKLEAALRKHDLQSIDILDTGSSGYCH